MALDAALGRLGIRPGVCTSSTRPANPFEGQVIYETDTNNIRFWSGSAWESNKGAVISSAAPSSPAAGDIWYDSDDGRAYVYYDDGSSQQWVEFGAPPVQHGKILQVVSTTKTDTFSASLAAGADTAITGLSATITPTSATSQILVLFQSAGARANDLPYFFVRLYRGATEIGSGATASNRTSVIQASGVVALDTTALGPLSGHFLDSPATTSATTYALHAANVGSSTHTFYVNRSQDDTDAANFPRTSSSITVMEVSA